MSNEQRRRQGFPMKNVIQEKSFEFAARVVRLCRHLQERKDERILSRQLLRAGTSVGANVEEALGGVSLADFANKMSIAYKEARENSYWLRLLERTGHLTPRQFASIHADIEEIIKLLFTIRKTARTRKEIADAK
ncbi:MAG: four helix bundle protein [Opitutaceae bacterium]|jgi:four helix bundle protein|nr:four helix bundle protein [Opitutaceae bacterium]